MMDVILKKLHMKVFYIVTFPCYHFILQW